MKMCLVHDLEKHLDAEAVYRCKECVKKADKRLAERRKNTAENPGVCQKHHCTKYWDANGKARCKICKKEYDSRRDREYSRWLDLNDKCHNPNGRAYGNYGRRGIAVYGPWRRDPDDTFENNYKKYLLYKNYLITHLRPRKEGESLNRVDNNKGYEPNNLDWATCEEQNNNKRVNVKIRTSVPDDSLIYYPYGILTTIADFANKVGMNKDVAKWRYAWNWEAEWILDPNVDRRMFWYVNHFYNQRELQIISGFSRSVINSRLRKGWSVKDTIEKPVRLMNYR